MRVLQLGLFTLQLLLSQSQRKEVVISDGSGHITTSVERLSGDEAMIKTDDGSSGHVTTNVERLLRSGNAAIDKTESKRRLRRRRQRLVKWCDSRMKAKEIDNDIEWKKIIGATVLVLGLVHFLYFYHTVCNRMEE